MATLEKVAGRLTRQRALMILIDGLDHFRPSEAGDCLSWLPDSWPKHVHVVFTTDSADERTIRNLGNHVRRIIRSRKLNKYVVDECFFRVEPLDDEEQRCMIESLRAKSQRDLTPPQQQVSIAMLPYRSSYCDNL